MKSVVDWSVYVVTDRPLARGRPLEQVVEAALRGGATVIQLREKEASTREFIALGQRLQELCRAHQVPLIINDRLDVVLAIEADGVHVGQEDMPVALARRLLGPDEILGATASTPQEARQAEADGADYLGCNAVFYTPTKTDTGTPLGIKGFRRLVQVVSIPVVAIGGIKATNAAELIQAGAAGVAVVSAVMAADDPEAAARELCQVVRAARKSTT
jgi:thiamine-phosphate pyrophosphorylase